MEKLGLLKHAIKEVWGPGSTILDHLGFTVDTKRMMISVTARKQIASKKGKKRLLYQARMKKGLILGTALSSFFKNKVSLMLAVPLALFFTGSVNTTLPTARRVHVPTKFFFRMTSKLNLLFWRKLGSEGEGRFMLDQDPMLCTHSYAADIGWAGYLAELSSRMEDGISGSGTQRIWCHAERVKTIYWRELRALRKINELLPDSVSCKNAGPLLKRAAVVANSATRLVRLKCWVDNETIVFIVHSMVTVSTNLMPELRLLKKTMYVKGMKVEPSRQ